MLAWLHQATASEKEHLEALLKQVTLPGEIDLQHPQVSSYLKVSRYSNRFLFYSTEDAPSSVLEF